MARRKSKRYRRVNYQTIEEKVRYIDKVKNTKSTARRVPMNILLEFRSEQICALIDVDGQLKQ